MKVKLKVEIKVKDEWKQKGSQIFDVGRMSKWSKHSLNLTLFDVQHSNNERQNDLNKVKFKVKFGASHNVQFKVT